MTGHVARVACVLACIGEAIRQVVLPDLTFTKTVSHVDVMASLEVVEFYNTATRFLTGGHKVAAPQRFLARRNEEEQKRLVLENAVKNAVG